jgi:hypothetical protein
VTTENLELAYRRMADFTAPLCGPEWCGSTGAAQTKCCSAFYCKIALDRAEEFGVDLEMTDHPELPLMGETGCTAPPYLRPACTLHHCKIYCLGILPSRPDLTAEYFLLRAEVMDAEELFLAGAHATEERR